MADKKEKYVYRFPPCYIYDMEAMESWLGDMAAKGLVLHAVDSFPIGIPEDCYYLDIYIFIFCRSLPKFIRYRLDASCETFREKWKNCGKPDREAIELNADLGWNYVTSCGPFHFYCTGSHDTREMHTDPQVQAMTIDILRKKERINLGFSFVYLIMNILFFVNEFLLSEGTGLCLYADSIPLSLQLVLGLWLFILLLVRQFYLWNLRKRLSGGSHPNHIKNWHHTAALCRFSLIFTILLTASVLALSIYTAFFR